MARRRTHARAGLGWPGLLVLLGCLAAAPPPTPLPAPGASGASSPWRALEPGLAYAAFVVEPASSAGDSTVRALRIDPARFALRLVAASARGGGSRTVRQWAEREGLVAAINPSMYQADGRTSVGLLVAGDHVNNGHVTADRAVLAFDPVDASLPPVQLIDRECHDLDALRPRYRSLVQSIRMLSCRGRNVWAQQPERVSTAAIGVDREGRVLFLHARSPWSTHDFVEILRRLPLDLSGAMYGEGGPQAQLYVKSGDFELEAVGLPSTPLGVGEGDALRIAWPVPNVLGAVRRADAAP